MVICTCVDAFIKSLSSVEQRQIHPFVAELRIIQMFLWCSVTCDPDAYLRSIFTAIESIWRPDGTSEDIRKLFYLAKESKYYGKVLDKLEKKILLGKRKIKKLWKHLTSKSLKCKPLRSHEIQQFLDAIINNMDHLLANDVIETHRKKLLMLRNLVEFTFVLCLNCKALKDFNIHVLTSANTALLSLTFSGYIRNRSYCYGLLSKHESKRKRTNYWVDELLQKVKPSTREFIDLCFALIKKTKSSSLDIIFYEELVSTFVDFLLQNSMLTSEYGFNMLREGLIYLTTFLACSPPNSTKDSDELFFIHTQIDKVLHASRLICIFGEAKVDFSKGKMVLAELINMIDKVRGEIDKLCVHIPLSTWYSFPRTDGLGFMDKLLVYLEDLQETISSHPKLAPSLKRHIFIIKEELMPFRPFLQHISKLLNEQELKDL